MRANASRAILPASIGAMAATAWVAIWALGESPWGHWSHALGPGGHGAPLSFASTVSLSVAFITGWVVMTVAMMLPTSLPLLQIFGRLTVSRPNRLQLVLLVIAGYLAAWTLCGVAVFVAAVLIQRTAGASEWLTSYPKAPIVALFLVAGAFQFSSLKYRCLDKCRSPLSFVTAHWRGARERWRSFRLGLEHGAFCVGCCWALMLLMFAAGTASLVSMLALGGVMAVEKNVSWGRSLSAPLGLALIAAGVAIGVLPGR
jgi:predicted metal-binding membrane protein